MSPAPRILSPRVFLPIARVVAPLLQWLPVSAIARGLEALWYGLGTFLVLILVGGAPGYIAFTIGLALSVCASIFQHMRWPPGDGGNDGPRYA